MLSVFLGMFDTSSVVLDLAMWCLIRYRCLDLGICQPLYSFRVQIWVSGVVCSVSG